MPNLTKEEEAFRAQLIQEFIKITERYKCPGWIEYQLWETLEGKRSCPFAPFFDPLSDEELDILRLFRDELKEWLVWDHDRWTTADIDSWRDLAGTSRDD